ncbi:MAG: hypothetical protein ABI790_15300 [Betaproteobacteria bacterium]
MKRITLASMLLTASTAYLPFIPVASAAPLELLGVKPGSTHRMALGGGEITAKVVDTGKDGWVLFSVTSDDIRWQRGARLWINLDRIDNISAATAATSASPTPPAASLSDSEIANLPCFSQVEARDAQAIAKGQAFDRNQFLTECILNQRRKP